MRGDLNSAANYLKGYETDPRAYNNIGILHLLQGDTSKAEVYLMMAQAAGVTEATQVLSAIRY
jgi:Flp pilus assembly protein TadD